MDIAAGVSLALFCEGLHQRHHVVAGLPLQLGDALEADVLQCGLPADLLGGLRRDVPHRGMGPRQGRLGQELLGDATGVREDGPHPVGAIAIVQGTDRVVHHPPAPPSRLK